MIIRKITPCDQFQTLDLHKADVLGVIEETDTQLMKPAMLI